MECTGHRKVGLCAYSLRNAFVVYICPIFNYNAVLQILHVKFVIYNLLLV